MPYYGMPDKCEEPSGSPLLSSWMTTAVPIDETTTTTPSPEESPISIPASGNACDVQDNEDVVILPGCSYFRIRYEPDYCPYYQVALIQYSDCYTNRIQTVALNPDGCANVFSTIFPRVLYESETCQIDGGGGGGGGVIIDPVECDPVPPQTPTDDPESPEPEPDPEPSPPDPENPTQPRPDPTDPIPPTDPNDPKIPGTPGEDPPNNPPTSQQFRVLVVGDGYRGSPVPSYRVQGGSRDGYERILPLNANYNSPLVEIDNSILPVYGRVSASPIKSQRNAGIGDNYTEDQYNKQEFVFRSNTNAATSANDRPAIVTFNTDPLDSSLVIDFNNQSLSSQGSKTGYINRALVLVEEYKDDRLKYYLYLSNPNGHSGDQQFGTKNNGLVSSTVSPQANKTDHYKRDNIASIGGESALQHFEIQRKDDQYTVTAPETNHLVSHSSYGFNAAKDSQYYEPGSWVNPSYCRVYGYGPNPVTTTGIDGIRTPIYLTYLKTKSELRILPTNMITAPSILRLGSQIQWTDATLNEERLRTIVSRYRVEAFIQEAILTQYVSQTNDDSNYRVATNLPATNAFRYLALRGDPFRRAGHVRLKNRIYAIFSDGTIGDLTDELLSDLGSVTVTSSINFYRALFDYTVPQSTDPDWAKPEELGVRRNIVGTQTPVGNFKEVNFYYNYIRGEGWEPVSEDWDQSIATPRFGYDTAFFTDKIVEANPGYQASDFKIRNYATEQWMASAVPNQLIASGVPAIPSNWQGDTIGEYIGQMRSEWT